MPQFVIHVGPHKTGSTYIQRRLAAAAAALQAQGIVVPVAWCDSPANPSHTGLVARLTPAGAPDIAAQFAAWDRAGAATVVLSCESLMNVAPEQLELLRTLIGGHPFHIVYYLRAWPERMISMWNEVVVHGELVTLPEYMLYHLRDPFDSGIINPALDLQRFEAAFGAAALRLVSYNAVLAAQQDVFAHFAARFLGNPKLPQAVPEIANASFAPEEAELVRALNALHQAAGGQASARIAEAYRHGPARGLAAPFLELLRRYRRSTFIENHKRPTANVVTHGFSRYAELLVPPLAAGRPYPPGITQVQFTAPDYAMRPGFMAGLQRLREAFLT